MADATKSHTGDRTAQPPRGIRILPVIGILLAASAAFWVANSPDGGASATSVWEGVTFGAVLAAAPVAALSGGVTGHTLGSLGGGATVAGLVTTPGGNLLGLAMAAVGLMLLLPAVSKGPNLNPRSLISLFSYSAALAVGMWLSLAANVVNSIAAIVLAIIVVIATRRSAVRS